MFANYPIVVIPQPILDLVEQSSITEEQADANLVVTLPQVESPSPIDPLFEFWHKKRIRKTLRIARCFSYGAIAFMVAVAHPSKWIMLLVLFLGLLIHVVVRNFLREEIDNFYSSYRKLLRHRRNKYRQSNQDYIANLQEAQNQYIVSNYEREIAPQISLAQKLKLYLDDNCSQGVEKEEAQKGVSEAFFASYLKQYFGDCYTGSQYFQIPNFKYGYTTDFALIEPQSKLAIDIEIDEPYDGKSKKPHHCQDVNKDERRNQFFNERGWVVIRFSELQVVSQPESCCRAIALLITQLTGLEVYCDRTSYLPNLKQDATWTQKKATILARRRYREKYLAEYGLFIQRKIS